MTRLKNGHHNLAVLEEEEPMIARRLYDRLRDRLIETEEDLRITRRAKSQLEERIAEERAIHAADREFWRRLGKPDIARTASDSACLHTAGEKA